MRGKISKVTSILAIAVILLTMSKALAAEPSEPHPGDSIWIEPSTINLSTGTYPVGYKFNVTVWINMTVTTVTWQFKLAYNKNHLNATRCGYTA